MRERLRWLGHALQIKDDRLSFLDNHLGSNKKQVTPNVMRGCFKEIYKRNENFFRGCKEGGF